MEFKRARGKGYNIAEVDTFMHQAFMRWNDCNTPLKESEVRKVHFSVQKKGYCKHEVNLSLKHLELSIAKQNKNNSARLIGRAKFDEHIYEQLTELFERLHGKKVNFARGDKGEKAYSICQVDKFLAKLEKSLMIKKSKIERLNVKHEVFDMRAGRKGYSAIEVDNFLDDLTTYVNALTVQI
ncbi:MAG: hypothetical protein LBC50_02345 [Candidatus Ancillula sp.]|jgi:DivIVA domain-containing protein|nr:hypothetical protein [Candidatus Ancillula sp.]